MVDKNGWAVVYDSKLDRTAAFGNSVYYSEDWKSTERIAKCFESGEYKVKDFLWDGVDDED